MRTIKLNIDALENLPDRISIVDDSGGFSILLTCLKDKRHRIRISFSRPHAFRRMDEGDCIKILSKFEMPVGSAYEVFDSDFLRGFHNESCGMHEKARHFIFFTLDDVIDVIADEYPKIESWTIASEEGLQG